MWKRIYNAFLFGLCPLLRRTGPLTEKNGLFYHKIQAQAQTMAEVVQVLNLLSTFLLQVHLYSAGLRHSELLNLKFSYIESERMLIKVVREWGNKERYTLLGQTILKELRAYYHKDKPKLFEGQEGGKYSETIVEKIVKRLPRDPVLSEG